jgi:hypothetical protein
MASIEKYAGKRGTSWYVQIRRAGYPPINQKFKTRADAVAFANRTEANMAEGNHFGMSRVRTVAELLDEYEREAPPIKSARDREPILRWWREKYRHILLRDVTPAMLVQARRELSTEEITKPGHKKKSLRGPATVRHYLQEFGQALKFGASVMRWIDRQQTTRSPHAASSRFF